MKNTKRQQPIIGILPDYSNGEENSYSTKSFYAQNCNLVDSVFKANAIPILITYQSKNIDDYLNLIDGLLISGGDFDIDPVFYNENFIHPKTKLNPLRNHFEIDIIKKALAKKTLPILGICNGMQLICVVHGSKLIQHICEEQDQNYLNHEQSDINGFENYEKAFHHVSITANSQFAKIIGEDKIYTNSAHHQAVRSVNDPIKVVGISDDGIIEAIENQNHPFCIGVEWHPEYYSSSSDEKLFNEFVNKSQQFLQNKIYDFEK